MIVFLLSTLIWAKHPCYGVAAIDPGYADLNKKVVGRVVISAELVTIASEADAVLSKLIAAKSPVLVNWLNKRNLLSANEDIIAKEWRLYYLNNFILRDYPTKNTKINESVEALFADINQLAFDKTFKDRLQKIFKDVKRQALQVVRQWPLTESQKKTITHKIDTIKLYWFEKLAGTRYQKKPLEFLEWGLAYDPMVNEINVGVHAKKYPTDTSLYAVLAHEIGHAFDSCRWSNFFQGPSPFKKLDSCLRDPNATGAKTRDDSQLNESIRLKLLSQEMATSLKLNPTCNRVNYPPEGYQKDQILEVFADWFSAEVFAQSPHLANFPRPDLCDRSDTQATSSYLENRERIDRLYFTHPVISKKHGVAPKYTYCPLEI